MLQWGDFQLPHPCSHSTDSRPPKCLRSWGRANTRSSLWRVHSALRLSCGRLALISCRFAEVVALVVGAEQGAGFGVDVDHLARAPDAGVVLVGLVGAADGVATGAQLVHRSEERRVG